MPLIELVLASKESSLSVRNFTVREGMSSLFEVNIVARSTDEDLDLESIVGKPASFSLGPGGELMGGSGRSWSGVCSRIEQIQAEPDGLSTYGLRIVPTLWLLTQRRGNRIFQHLSIPSIIEKLLLEWGILATFRLDASGYPTHEYRVQYGETDFAFMARLLEEAGIAYFFADEGGTSRLVFSDRPQTAEHRHGSPIPYVDNAANSVGREYVTRVHLAHEVRPGKYIVRDYDFRGKPSYALFGAATAQDTPEVGYEQYHYSPGAFVDDRSSARVGERAGTAVAEVGLDGLRVSKREVVFQTNVLDFAVGLVFAMDRHPHSELGPSRPLLITELTVEGSHDSDWTIAGRALSAEHPYRPPRLTPKPRIFGIQSALVVGPEGEEIHTDPFGRVRVQFHWDREGRYDDDSSCWVRVSQGWAGGGFGLITIPRVGHEVLVGFFEGDPDQPVIIGRVFNGEALVPYELPANKTVSTWKSNSSPASGGFNEIKFEDARGRELVYVQAERDLEKLVKENELENTGVNRTITVGMNRTATVGAVDSTVIGERYSASMAPRSGVATTAIEMAHGRIVLTTGEASITLEGPNITLAAKGVITVKSDGNDVVIQGGPWVKINCGAEGDVVSDTVTMHHITGILRDQDGVPLAGRKVVVTASDGSVHQIETDSSGRYFAVVPPGKCQVSLPGNLRYGTKGTHFDDMTLDPELLNDCGPIE